MTILPQSEAVSQDTLIVRDRRKPRQFSIENQIIEDWFLILGADGYSLYSLYVRMSNSKDERAWPGYTYIRSRLGCSYSTISDHNKLLQWAGLVHIVPGDRNTANEYYILEVPEATPERIAEIGRHVKEEIDARPEDSKPNRFLQAVLNRISKWSEEMEDRRKRAEKRKSRPVIVHPAQMGLDGLGTTPPEEGTTLPEDPATPDEDPATPPEEGTTPGVVEQSSVTSLIDKVEEDSINNNGAGENSPIADAAAGDLSLSQFLTDNGIRGKKLKDILKLNPPVEHARSWLEYARSTPDVKKPEGFMIAMLLDEVPPPQKRNGRWYTDDELRENFVPSGVDAWEWKKNQGAMTPEQWEATLSDHVPDGMLVTGANGKKYRQIGSHRLPEGVFYDQFNQRLVRQHPDTGEWIPTNESGYYVAKPFDEAESERIKAEIGAAFDGIKARRNSLTPEQEKLCREIDAKHGRSVPGWTHEDWQTETPDFIKE